MPVVPNREPGAGREVGTLRVLERLGVADLRTGAVRAGVLRVVVGTLLRVVEERLELAGKGPTMGLLEERFVEGRGAEERVTGWRAGAVDLRTGAVRAGVLRVVVGTLLRVVVEAALRLGCTGVARTGTREGGVLTVVGAGRVTV